MITVARLHEWTKNFDGQPGSNHADSLLEDLVSEAIQECWSFRSWPFHLKEAALVMEVPITSGTIQYTLDSTTVTLNGATYGSSLPVPSRLFISNVDEDFIITTRSSATGLVMDSPYPGVSGSGSYEIQFPAYELPSDFDRIATVIEPDWFARLENIDFSEYLNQRVSNVWAGSLRYYSILKGDNGDVPSRIWLYPSPNQRETIRFTYWRKPPESWVWNAGTATVTAGSTSVTGAETYWDQVGRSLAGAYLEVPGQKHARAKIASVASGTGLTLESNWPGQTSSIGDYVISPRIDMPESLIPALQNLCKSKVCDRRRDYAGKNIHYQAFKSDANRAFGSEFPTTGFKRGMAGMTEDSSEPRVTRAIIIGN